MKTGRMCFVIKLCIGGSPCTHWSIAKTKNRETEPSGLGWELFENYLFALDLHKADFFLYENNKSMSAAIREEITKRLGVEPICINSALVSAQNRQRLYWTNIPGVKQPEDRGILLRDILESGVCWREKSYTLKANYTNAGAVNGVCGQHFPAPMAAEPVRIGTIESAAKNQVFDNQPYRVYSPHGKSVTLCGQGGGFGAKTWLYAVPIGCDVVVTENNIRCQRRDKKHSTVQGSHVSFENSKSQTMSPSHVPRVLELVDGKARPIYEVRNGLITIKGKQYPIKLADGFYIIRKLTVRECMRLQTVPEWYEFPVSDTQAYKMLGNGWTVDVIAHILSYCPGITTEELDVLSMYDGMACGHLALDKLGANIMRYRATEIDKYAIKTACHNFPDIQQLGDAFHARNHNWLSERPRLIKENSMKGALDWKN